MGKTGKHECPFTADGRHINGCGCNDAFDKATVWHNRKRGGKHDKLKDEDDGDCTATKTLPFSEHVHMCTGKDAGHSGAHGCFCGTMWT